MSTEEVRGIFRHALDNLRTCGGSVPFLRGAEFDFLRQDVVRNTVLDPSLPRAGRIYDHLVRNTPPVFQFTDAVLSAFDRYWHENQLEPSENIDIIKKLLNHLQEIAMNQRDKNLYKELGQRI